MTYDITIERYGTMPAWWSSQVRDALQGFRAISGKSLQRTISHDDPEYDAVVTCGLAGLGLPLRGVATDHLPDGSERCSYLFVDEGRAAVEVETGWRGLTLTAAAASRGEARELIARIDALIPRREEAPQDIVPIRFWRKTSCGAEARVRELRCPEFEALRGNYDAALHAKLEDLAGLERPDERGKVILWHGPPGTGKTYAVRGLARAWHENLGASIELILDPDELFARADYLHEVLLNDDADEWDDAEGDAIRPKSRLRLVIIEDSACLFADACRSTPGFGRLLNLSDGIIGQGLRIVFLLTANEEITRIDPAITRAGRCLAVNEFGAIPVEQGRAWFAARGGPPEALTENLTIAELYARLTALPGRTAAPPRERPQTVQA